MNYIDQFLEAPIELQIIQVGLTALAVLMILRAAAVLFRLLRGNTEKGDNAGN